MSVRPFDHLSVGSAYLLSRMRRVALVVRGVPSERQSIVRILRHFLMYDLSGTPVLVVLLIASFDWIWQLLLRYVRRLCRLGLNFEIFERSHVLGGSLSPGVLDDLVLFLHVPGFELG